MKQRCAFDFSPLCVWHTDRLPIEAQRVSHVSIDIRILIIIIVFGYRQNSFRVEVFSIHFIHQSSTTAEYQIWTLNIRVLGWARKWQLKRFSGVLEGNKSSHLWCKLQFGPSISDIWYRWDPNILNICSSNILRNIFDMWDLKYSKYLFQQYLVIFDTQNLTFGLWRKKDS